MKQFFCKYGRKVLLTLLFVASALLIAHFVSQYYYRQGIIDRVFGPQALIVSPEKVPSPPPRPAPVVEPKGGSAPAKPTPAPKPAERPAAPVDDDVKVEVFGLIKFELSETNSWQTIAKIMTVILGTFFGIRAINALFNKIEDDHEEEEPAAK